MKGIFRILNIYSFFLLFFATLHLIGLNTGDYSSPSIKEGNNELQANQIYTTKNQANKILPQSSNKLIVKDPFNKIRSTEKQCDGIWINSKETGRIELAKTPLISWGLDTPPSVLEETLDLKNTVVMGHNICEKGYCNKAGSQFSKIINLKVGDFLSYCDGVSLQEGYVFISNPVSEKETRILLDWTLFPTLTMFTSYGRCNDSECTSTNQRWLVAFERF